MRSLYICTGALALLFSTGSMAQEPVDKVGEATELGLDAHDLYSRSFSVLGKRRVDMSFQYSASDQQTIITNNAARSWSLSAAYTHPLSDKAELTLSVPFSYQTSELGVGEEKMDSDSSSGIRAVSIGGRYTLKTESDGVPEITLLGSLNAPVNAGVNDGKWGGSIGLSFVTSSYPAYIYGSGSVIVDEDDTAFAYTAGLALAINDQLNAGFVVDGMVGNAKLPGTLGESTTITTRLTYALNSHWAVDAGVGFGLTGESPDRVFSLGLGYRF